jgi:outer membrane immunogenic protein
VFFAQRRIRFLGEMSAFLETVPPMSRWGRSNRGRDDLENEEILMKKFAIMAAVAAVALLAAPTAANADWYAGAAYTQFDFDGGEADAITGRLGYKFGPNLAVEGEGSFGVDEDEDLELNHNLGAYAVGILPVTSAIDLHARVGYQQTEVDTPLGGQDDEGLGYGAGATWNLTPSFGIRGDWTRLEGDEDDADALSLGGVLRF